MRILDELTGASWGFHLAACVGCFLAGVAVMWPDHKPATMPPAPAIVQDDGSRILERNPPAKPPALPQIPKGFKVTRVTTAELEMKPAEPGIDPARPQKETVQFTEVQDQAGGSRIIASSPDGNIIGGADWVQRGPAPTREYHWQALAVREWTPRGGQWGVSLAYVRGPLVGSVTVVPGGGGALMAGIGFRW